MKSTARGLKVFNNKQSAMVEAMAYPGRANGGYKDTLLSLYPVQFIPYIHHTKKTLLSILAPRQSTQYTLTSKLCTVQSSQYTKSEHCTQYTHPSSYL